MPATVPLCGFPILFATSFAATSAFAKDRLEQNVAVLFEMTVALLLWLRWSCFYLRGGGR